ncbi:MAG TPA: hypothetical protein VF099_17910, partial [Ktedonobacterales bacterium]
MKILEPSQTKGSQPLSSKPKPSKKYIRRQRLFVGLSVVLLAAMVIVLLNQFGVISFLRSETTSSLHMITAEGILNDAQTDQPLAHISIIARIFSFETET